MLLFVMEVTSEFSSSHNLKLQLLDHRNIQQHEKTWCMVCGKSRIVEFFVCNFIFLWAGYNGFVSCKDGVEVIGNVGEDHKPGVSLYGLICFIYGQHAISLKKMEQSARRDAVCHSLAKFYDSPEALKVI